MTPRKLSVVSLLFVALVLSASSIRAAPAESVAYPPEQESPSVETEFLPSTKNSVFDLPRTFSVVTVAAPAAVPGPSLISPAYGAETTGNPDDPEYLSGDRVLYQPLGVPLFLWAPVPGVTKYKLQINTMPDFSGFMAVDKADLAYTGYAPTAGTPLQDWKADGSMQHPQEDKLYYWRVGAYDSSTYSWAWSDTRYFTRHWGYMPQHIAPADMSGTNDYFEAEPMFQWSAVPGASFYELQAALTSLLPRPTLFTRARPTMCPTRRPYPTKPATIGACARIPSTRPG